MTSATCPSWCDAALCELTDAGTPDAAHGHRVKLDELVGVVQWSPVDGTPAAPPVVSLLPSDGDLTAQDAREVAAALVRAAELVEDVEEDAEDVEDVAPYAAGHLDGCHRSHRVELWDVSDVLPRFRDRVAFDDFLGMLRDRGVRLVGERVPRFNDKGERCGDVMRVRSCELLRFRAVQAVADQALTDAVAASVRP